MFIMKTNVKNYTSKQLLDRMKGCYSFTGMPKGHHIIAVRSNEDAPNVYDDKLYLFKGERFIAVMTCTTNTGTYGLRNFFKWNKLGAAVIKSNEVYYNAFIKSDGKKYRHHNGKMQCLRQIRPIKYFRDNNLNNKTEELGKIYYGNYSTNIHCNSYTKRKGILTWLIGGWSTGCIVINNLTMYYYVLLDRINYNEEITLSVLKEF